MSRYFDLGNPCSSASVKNRSPNHSILRTYFDSVLTHSTYGNHSYASDANSLHYRRS